MQAKDVMTTEVVTVDPESDVTSVAKILFDRRISAAPVVDRDGRIVGIVSEGDLIRRTECPRGRSWWLALVADTTAEFVRTHGTRAKDVMTRHIISIGEEAPLSEVARILESNNIKRVPVIKEGRLVGLVSRADILRGLAAFDRSQEAQPAAEDRDIRARILKLVKQETEASTQSVNVIVVKGQVYLWGIAETDQDRDAMRIAAENVVGAGKVHNFLNTLSEVVRGTS